MKKGYPPSSISDAPATSTLPHCIFVFRISFACPFFQVVLPMATQLLRPLPNRTAYGYVAHGAPAGHEPGTAMPLAVRRVTHYRPDGSAHALPEGSALGGLLDCQAGAEAPMVARIVVLAIPSQVPDQGIARSQDATERSWFKSQGFVVRQ